MAQRGTGQQKGSEKGAAGPGPVADDPRELRNVVVVGHSGVGKTTLVEALLAATGTIERAGTVTDGTTVCDADPAAVRQQRSVNLAVAPVLTGGTKINFLDTPGYSDFVGELRAGLRAADAALFVVSAVDGMDAATIALWDECAAVALPRGVVVTRLDAARADFDETVALCQRVFGEGVLPLYLPVHGERAAESPEDAGEPVVGLIGLLSQTVFDYSNGYPPAEQPAQAEHVSAIEEARNALIEGVIAESEDETLMDRYLDGETIDEATLIADLEKAVARGSFYPVIPVDAPSSVGLDAVLSGIVRGFPGPTEHNLPAVTDLAGTPREPLAADPTGPLVAEVVKTTVDPYVGRVCLVRVFSGTLSPEVAVHIAGHGLADRGHPDHDADERITHLYSPLGTALREVPRCIAGDVCAVTKSGTAETGDTISAKSDPLLIEQWQMPEPLLPVAITAHTRSDEDALARNMSRLVAGDPTLRLERNAETRQLVLWCMGEAHADVVLDRLRAGGAEVDTEPVRVALRETFAATGTGHGRHVKQSGGHGQYAVCDIEVHPLPAGEGFEYLDKVVGGAVPHQYIPSVEKGVVNQLAAGLAAGYPMVDVRVTLTDGKAHSVDSSDAAFQTAGALALKDAAAKAGVTLLEPLDEIGVLVPDNHVGTVLSDLSARRGRVLGTEQLAGERTLIRAEVPATELLRYAVELRSMTSGTGSFTRHFTRYEPMPAQLADRVRAEHAAR